MDHYAVEHVLEDSSHDVCASLQGEHPQQVCILTGEHPQQVCILTGEHPQQVCIHDGPACPEDSVPISGHT